MNKQTFFFVTGLVFTFAAGLHLARAAMSVQMSVGSLNLPLWASWAFGIFIFFMAVQAWILGIKTKRN